MSYGERVAMTAYALMTDSRFDLLAWMTDHVRTPHSDPEGDDDDDEQ